MRRGKGTAFGFPILIFIIISSSISLCRADDKLIPYEENDLWGYKNGQSVIVIPPQFQHALPFTAGGIAGVVSKEGEWCYINARGQMILKPVVVDNGPDYFSEGLARYVHDKKLGFFDVTGAIVIKAVFEYALPVHEGLAAVGKNCRTTKDGEHRHVLCQKWGFINRQGTLVIPYRFDEVVNFQNGKAKVKLEGKWNYINKNGAILIK